MQESDYFETNKSLWNQKTLVHVKSEFYDIKSFKTGKSSLNTTEINELGNINGKNLLHLQCHFGMDTLSLAKHGAITTGVDLSDEAIKQAKTLSNELNISSNFICCNIYDLKSHLNSTFDVVFTSYGTIGWLPDLNRWANIISHFLKPGGFFYIIDFHPVVWMFDNDFKYIQYPYHNLGVIEEELEGTYADRNANIKHKSFGWNHSLSEIINALISNNLKIEFLNEFDFSHYNCFNNMIQDNQEKFRIKNLENKIPMMYSIKAIKQ